MRFSMALPGSSGSAPKQKGPVGAPATAKVRVAVGSVSVAEIAIGVPGPTGLVVCSPGLALNVIVLAGARAGAACAG